MSAVYPYDTALARGSRRRDAAIAALRLLDEPLNKLVADELTSYSEFRWWVDPIREAVVYYLLEWDTNRRKSTDAKN